MFAARGKLAQLVERPEGNSGESPGQINMGN